MSYTLEEVGYALREGPLSTPAQTWLYQQCVTEHDMRVDTDHALDKLRRAFDDQSQRLQLALSVVDAARAWDVEPMASRKIDRLVDLHAALVALDAHDRQP